MSRAGWAEFIAGQEFRGQLALRSTGLCTAPPGQRLVDVAGSRSLSQRGGGAGAGSVASCGAASVRRASMGSPGEGRSESREALNTIMANVGGSGR